MTYRRFFVEGTPITKGSAKAFVNPRTGRAVVVQDNAERQRPWAMLIELRKRVKFENITTTEPFLVGHYSEIEDVPEVEDHATVARAIAYLEQYAEALGEANQQIMANTRSKLTSGELSDYIAGLINLPFETELDLLTTINGPERLNKTITFLTQELRIIEVRNKIQQDAREGADKAQREYLLREQMRAIRKMSLSS